MRTLLLSGYGIGLSVDSGRLHVRDGSDYKKEPKEYVFKPKFIDYDSIVIYEHSGNISLDLSASELTGKASNEVPSGRFPRMRISFLMNLYKNE